MQNNTHEDSEPIQAIRRVIRQKEITIEDVKTSYSATLGDWSLREQDTFVFAVVASHGWNYHNAMAAMAIQ